VLYLRPALRRAAPQCISGRTSYLRVRLAFHPDPQLIRAVCNPHRFGPPRPVTGASPWPWVAHAVSGLPDATNALFRLAFAVAAAVAALTKPRRVTRRIILQKARRQGGLRPTPSTAWTHTVSGSVSLPSPGYFSPFPHGTVRYRSRRVGSLGRWAAQLHTGLHVSGTTQVPTGREDQCLLRGYHPLWRRVPHGFAYWVSVTGRAAARRGRSSNPVIATPAGLARRRFGLSPVRSPLLRGYFLFLGVREMVQFPRFPHACACHGRSRGVAPFGDCGITACARLPHTYRSSATSFIGTTRRGIHHVRILSSLPTDVGGTRSAARAGVSRRPGGHTIWNTSAWYTPRAALGKVHLSLHHRRACRQGGCQRCLHP
jgi:hypothetical protein